MSNLGGDLRFERVEDVGSGILVQGSDQVGCLICLHLGERGRGSRGAELLDDVGRRIGPHLIEDLTDVLDVDTDQQLGGRSRVEGLQDVGGVVRIRLDQRFPFLLMGLDVVLGVRGPAAGELTETFGEDALERQLLHGEAW